MGALQWGTWRRGDAGQDALDVGAVPRHLPGLGHLGGDVGHAYPLEGRALDPRGLRPDAGGHHVLVADVLDDGHGGLVSRRPGGTCSPRSS